MGECSTCPKERNFTKQTYYDSTPRNIRYSKPEVLKEYYPRRRPYGPAGCESVDMSPCGPYKPSPCIAPCLPYPSPCLDGKYYCGPQDTDSGLLHTIRNGFQRIFYGRKRCAPMCKGRVYNYSTSQLKFMEQHINKLEDETNCLECTIKEAFDCDCLTDCNSIRCSLINIMDQLEGLRCDLLCAYECYDPCRDRCEYELICTLLERVQGLQGLVNDLFLQLECLEYRFNCYPGACGPCGTYLPCGPCGPCGPSGACGPCGPCDINCRKPCCIRQPVCKPGCKKPCCFKSCDPCSLPACPKPCTVGCCKPACESGCKKSCCVKPGKWKGLCRTSSVIPVGVMLVKL